MLVLLATSHAAQRDELHELLVRLNCDVLATTSGARTWGRLQQEPVDLLLYEWEMPGLPGPALCARLRGTEELDELPVGALVRRPAAHWMDRWEEGATVVFEQQRRLYPTLLPLLATLQEAAWLERYLPQWQNAAHLRHQLRYPTDEVTGLLARAGWVHQAREKRERADARQQPVCLALLDLDGFAHVNDQYGYWTGDSLLRLVGSILELSLQPLHSVVGRERGNTFLLLLVGLSLAQATAHISRVLGRLMRADAFLPTLPTTRPVTIRASAGLCRVRPAAGLTLGAHHPQAASALPEAKRQGGQRVIVYRG